MQIIHHLQIDLARRMPVPPLAAVQNDANTRCVAIDLLENGSPCAVPDGVTGAVAFRKPDGHQGLYDTLPDGSKAVTIDGSTVAAILAPQVLSCAGEVSAAVVFHDAKLNQLATFPFAVRVEKNPAAGGQISNNYYALQNLDQVNAAYNDLMERVGVLENGGSGSGGNDSSQNANDYFLLKSPNGTVYRVKVSDTGTLYVDGVADPEEILDDLLEGRILAWSDEFDGTELSDVWSHEIGYVRNSEIQFYSDSSENIIVSDSILNLKALKNNPEDGYEWSSASIFTGKKYAFYRGLIEAKIRTEPNAGIWPAFWAKGDSYQTTFNPLARLSEGWPQCAEVDVVELVGASPYMRPGFFWYDDYQAVQQSKNNGISVDSVDDGWHIYGWERTDTAYNFYFDRQLVTSFDLTELDYAEELNRAMYIQLNIAVGGGSVGDPEDTLTESNFYVDWVRAYLPEGATEIIEPNVTVDCGESFGLNKGKTRILRPVWDSDCGSNYGVDWESSDTSVATVYGGKVTPVAEGICNITAKCCNGTSYTTQLTVSADVVNLLETVKIKASSDTIDNGGTISLSAYVAPDYATNTGVVWKSSDENIATVDSAGKVTNVNAATEDQTVTITCTSADGNAEDTIVLVCKTGAIADNIDTTAILYKYTKNGWSSDNTWADDTGNGNTLDFAGETASSYKISYVSGYGYAGTKSPTCKYTDLSIGDMDMTKSWTIVQRVYIPDLTMLQNSSALFTLHRDGYYSTTNGYCLNAYLYNQLWNQLNWRVQAHSAFGCSTDAILPPGGTPNTDLNSTFIEANIVNIAFIWDADNGALSVIVNNEVLIDGFSSWVTGAGSGTTTHYVASVMGYINEFSDYKISLAAYGQNLRYAYYQGLLVYEVAKTNDEVATIFNQLNEMYA